MVIWCPNNQGEECSHPIIPKPKSAFLIMSYQIENSTELDLIEKAIRNIFKDINFNIITARDIKKRGNMLCKICEQIQSVPIGIVLYTGKTSGDSLPNIFYETGMMHTLGKDIFLIGYKISKRPTDLSGIEWIMANDIKELRSELKKQIKTINELPSWYIFNAKRSEQEGNLEKAADNFMKSVLISPEGYINYLIEFRDRLKELILLQTEMGDEISGHESLLKRLNNFVDLLN